jgi:hypothetical protein
MFVISKCFICKACRWRNLSIKILWKQLNWWCFFRVDRCAVFQEERELTTRLVPGNVLCLCRSSIYDVTIPSVGVGSAGASEAIGVFASVCVPWLALRLVRWRWNKERKVGEAVSNPVTDHSCRLKWWEVCCWQLSLPNQLGVSYYGAQTGLFISESVQQCFFLSCEPPALALAHANALWHCYAWINGREFSYLINTKYNRKPWFVSTLRRSECVSWRKTIVIKVTLFNLL